MRRFETPAAFEVAFRTAAAAALPGAVVTVMRRTIVATKLRLVLTPTRFVDVFFNARNQRADLSVLEGARRILGYDNLGGCRAIPRPSRLSSTR